MDRAAFVLLCLALAGCAGGKAPVTRADAGAEVTLAPGEMAALKSPMTRVRFVAVSDDSRCPRDTTCIWAGEVKVQLEIVQVSQTHQVELTEGGGTSGGGLRVTLVRVEPQPVSTRKIAPQDYRATLKLDPN